MKNTRKFKFFKWGNFNFEIGDTQMVGFGIRFFGDGNTLILGFHFLFSFWVGISIKKLNNIVKNYENGWRLGISQCGRHLTINFFDGGDTGTFFIDIVTLITGCPTYKEVVIATGPKDLQMPEGHYPSVFTIKNQSWHYPRWGFMKYKHSMTISFEEGGVPIPGKGESAYDIGDDAIRSVTSGVDYEGENFEIQRAYNDFAISVLKTRQRLATIDWLPKSKKTK